MTERNTPQLHKEQRVNTATIAKAETENSLRIAGIILVVAALAWFVLEAVAASGFPEYSYVRNYISDLGATGVGTFQGRVINSQLSALANVMFMTQGAAFLAAAVLIVKRAAAGLGRTLFLLFAIGYAIGYVMIGAFHGSESAVADGTFVLHVAGGSLAVIFGNASLICAALSARRFGPSAAYRNFSLGISAVSIASLAILMLTSDTATGNQMASGPWDGFWERGGCYAIIIWELVTGVVLLKMREKG
jgi:hypothetical membrane protein